MNPDDRRCDRVAGPGPPVADPVRRPLRVLQVLEATEGGTRRHLLDLVTHLDPARFTVSLACATRRDPAFLDDIRELRARGIAVRVLPMRRAVSPAWDALALIQLVRLMRRGRFDVVHTHSSKAGFLGRLAARLAGVPRVVHTPHVFPFDMAAGPTARFCYRLLERFAARLTDCLVCVYPGQQAAACDLLDARRVVVIENEIAAGPAVRLPGGADRQALGLPPAGPLVGTIARLTRQKGPADFVEAARLVARAQPDARFVLAGEGELRPGLERQVAAAGLNDRLVLVGARDDVPDLLGLLDVVVLPSLWEGLPYLLLEAMAAGKAVVATRVGGMADVITDGVNGLLVPPRDSPALAAAIVSLLGNPARRAAIGEQARKTAANRPGLDRMVQRLSEVYGQVGRERRA